MVMQHLLELGHKHVDFIGHLSGENRDCDADEMEMYWRKHLDAVTGHGTSRFYRGGEDEAKKLVSELLASSDIPTALFVSNLSRAREIYAALREKKLRIPEDISIITVGWNVGGNGSDITIVSVEWFEVVRMAVHRLADRMDNKAHSAARLSCSGQFLDAGTTGPPRKNK
jgi:DNA-binding LacI/PurR family transcriptional regulator